MPVRGPRDDPAASISPGNAADPVAGSERGGSESGSEQENGGESSRAPSANRESQRHGRGPGYRIGFFRRWPYISSSTKGTHLNCPSRASGSTFR